MGTHVTYIQTLVAGFHEQMKDGQAHLVPESRKCARGMSEVFHN